MVVFKLFSASIARKQLGSENKLITGTITMPRSILLFERLWPHYNRMGLVDGDLARVSHIEKNAAANGPLLHMGLIGLGSDAGLTVPGKLSR
jgi:hypothetical protein